MGIQLIVWFILIIDLLIELVLVLRRHCLTRSLISLIQEQIGMATIQLITPMQDPHTNLLLYKTNKTPSQTVTTENQNQFNKKINNKYKPNNQLNPHNQRNSSQPQLMVNMDMTELFQKDSLETLMTFS
jgi:hypothetical protein